MRRAMPLKRHPVRAPRRRYASVAAVLLLMAVAMAVIRPYQAQATEAPVPGTAAWSLVHEAGQAYCLAHAFFPRSRIALGFVSDGERLGVALVHSGWRLREWQEYDAAFRFDGGAPVAARLIATDETALAVEIDVEAEQGFRRAAVVEVVVGGLRAGGGLSLAGSSRAIDYVRACGEIAALDLEPSTAGIRD